MDDRGREFMPANVGPEARWMAVARKEGLGNFAMDRGQEIFLGTVKQLCNTDSKSWIQGLNVQTL